MYCISCTLICTSILIIMLTLTMSYISHTRFASPSPLPLYSSDLVGAFICKSQNYCRNVVYIQFVILAIGITISCLTTIVCIVTTPVHWNIHSPLHTIKLVYCNNHPHKNKLLYTKNILLTNTLLFFKIQILIIWVATC